MKKLSMSSECRGGNKAIAGDQFEIHIKCKIDIQIQDLCLNYI